MRVLTGEEMRACDRAAIETLGIPGAVLMEVAGRAVARRARSLLEASGGRRVAVLCGGGNNGGDGWVAARHLAAAGFEVQVVTTKAPDSLAGDAALNQGIWARLGGGHLLFTDEEAPVPGLQVGRGDLIVDALLGTGLDRPVAGRTARLIARVNELRATGVQVLAVDVPSGISADTGQVLGVAVQADATVTFGYLKRGLVLHPGARLAGAWEVADIGLPPAVEAGLGPPVHWLTEAQVRGLAPPRPVDAHKGTAGHVLVVAGSEDKPGAAALACLGALRGGAGLVTLASRPGGLAVARARHPEVMGVPLPGTGALGPEDGDALLRAAEGKAAVALGPGIPRGPETTALVGRLLRELDVPLVLDADGLNALAEDPDLLKGAAVDVVLTPHPGEMARLTGRSTSDIQADRLGIAGEFARRHDAFVVLKGAHTVVADPDGAGAVNPTGNAGLATGGTGDLLTGLLAGLLAQGVSPGAAARLAVYAHGAAGDRAADRHGRAGLVASDLAEGLSALWREWGL